MQTTQKLFLIALMCATVYAQKGGGTVTDPYAGLPAKPTAEWLATQPDYNPDCQLKKFKPEEQFEKKEWICHGTASETNPYVLIHVAKSSLWKGHFDGGAPGHGKKNHDDIWPNTIGYDGVFYDCNCERPAVVPPPAPPPPPTVYPPVPREFVLTVGDTDGKEPENPADASKVTLIVTIAEKTVTPFEGQDSCYGESFRVNTLKVYGFPEGSTCQNTACCTVYADYIQFSGTSNTTADHYNAHIDGQVVDCLGEALTIVLPTNEDQFHGKIEYSVTAEIVTVTTVCPCDACSPSDSGVGHVIPLNDAPTIVFEGPANVEFGQSAPLFTSIAVKDADYYSAANTCPRIIRVRLSSESLWLGFKNGETSELGVALGGWNLFVRDTEGTYREVLVPVVDWTYSGSQKCGDADATGITCLDGEAAPNNAFSAIAFEIEYGQLNALLADVHFVAMENVVGATTVTLTVDDKIHTHTAYDIDGAEVTRGCGGFIGYEGEDVYEGNGRAWGVCPAAGCAAASVVVPVNVICRDVSGASLCDVGTYNNACKNNVWWMTEERVTQKNAYTTCATVNQTTAKTTKLQICHGTSSDTNPYNLLEVAASAAHGHLKRVITETCLRKSEELKHFAAYMGYTERLEWIPEVRACRVLVDTGAKDACWTALSIKLATAHGDGKYGAYTPAASGFDLVASLSTCCEAWSTERGITKSKNDGWCDLNFMDKNHGWSNSFDTCPGGAAYRATGDFSDIIEYPYGADKSTGTAFEPVWSGPTGGNANCLCDASVGNSAKFCQFMNGKHMGSGAVTNATTDLDWHEAPANAVNEGAANNLADNGVEKEDEEANNNAAGNSVSMSLPVFVVAVVAIAGVIGVLAVALVVTRRRKAPSTGYNAEVPAPVVQRTAKAWDRGSAMEVTHLTDVCASGDVEHPFEDTNATGLRPFEPNASLSHAFMKDVEDDA
jgi:Tfp pilus assembly major pilin PilA